MRNEREPAVEAKYSEMSILNLKSSVRFADDSVFTLSVCSTVLVERSTRSTRAIELSESPDGVVVTDIMAASISMVEPTAPYTVDFFSAMLTVVA